MIILSHNSNANEGVQDHSNYSIIREWRRNIVPVCILQKNKVNEFEFYILDNEVLGVIFDNHLFECNLIENENTKKLFWEVSHKGHAVCRKPAGTRKNFIRVLLAIKEYKLKKRELQ